jgi:peptidoglycan/LPS O-acetylase OafA/YrhL
MTKGRTDIQALRGLAVLLVLFYHLKLGGLEAGYLGVDIFFVISGYLITLLVVRSIERGEFSLKEFYFRRAKRLLPAAYVTIFGTSLVAPWFLNQQELQDFAFQVVGAVSFTSNIFLWHQTGYFDGASDLKPLLHTWSLSLEEQYYLVLPAMLLLLARRAWLRSVIAALLISLLLCAVGEAMKPIATFYLLPTRAWELLIGSAGALLSSRAGAESAVAGWKVVRTAFYPSAICLLLLGAFPLPGGHPGAGALIVCLSTIIVILRRHPFFDRSIVTAALARVGDMSYSLYLVHWPIISLMKNAWVGQEGELSASLRLIALGLSLVAAYLLYRAVEDPIRRSTIRVSIRLALKTGLATMLLLAITPVAILAADKSADFQSIRRVNHGMSKDCEFVSTFHPRPECSSSVDPTVMVWGDSYAMHLVPGLVDQPQAPGVVQATRSACGPILGVGPQRLENPLPGPVYDRGWAESCIEFNRSVLEYLKRTESIRIVVLSSPWVQYLTDDFALVMASGGVDDVVKPSVFNALSAFRASIEEVRAAGKRVVLIAPPPSADFNVGACLERQLADRIAIGGFKGCAIPVAAYRERRLEVLSFLEQAEEFVPVIRLSEFLCTPESCATLIDGTMIYRDEGHLSHDGSRLLAARMNWWKLIEDRAR